MSYNHRLEVLAHIQLKFAAHQKLAEHHAVHKLGQLLLLVYHYNHRMVLQSCMKDKFADQEYLMHNHIAVVVDPCLYHTMVLLEVDLGKAHQQKVLLALEAHILARLVLASHKVYLAAAFGVDHLPVDSPVGSLHIHHKVAA